ncbi:lysylphosphatidylglycerol synthase transmembrane domain-containing protein [Xanthovirga aplysinae]|uniref:lysylphosphatidylglycerol synthase transmembrane domain-containing protein n=1 Tax=Xanthovirga aplysinae TaxID=2529853 RepID=UPI0012BCDEAA|nr:lysylphosphatidylglycerol synthase transmembrane domain-containing protein [Xanthovirga aplysinae]MTI31530.1 flippase-like domain-containing protein [Xanthovirga aplysinae]
MKDLKFKSVLLYTISLTVALGLMWYIFRDLDFSVVLSKLKQLNYGWIALSVIIAISSHYARAYRWNLLLQPLGFQLKTWRTFLAVMSMYFVNLILPRMGEVSRCGVLKRTDKVPVTASLGTVVVERLVDFLALLFLLTIVLVAEFGRLKSYLLAAFEHTFDKLQDNLNLLFLLAGLVVLGVLGIIFLFTSKRSFLRNNPIILKVKSFLKDLSLGFTSIGKLQNKAGFWLSTLLIWAAYYLMAYFIIFAYPPTVGLSMWAGLSILVMGGLGMAAPVQGGLGTYHAMVSGILILYGISEQDGIIFATIMHSAQTLMVLILGGICLLLSLLISPKEKEESQTKQIAKA